MSTMSIADSVAEPLVIIRKASNLRAGVTGTRDELNKNQADIDKSEGLSRAEKLAVKCGWTLQVSWAETDTPEAHKAALVEAHEGNHDSRPRFKCPTTGEWAPGVVLVDKQKGENWSALAWSPWQDLTTVPRDAPPQEPGVIRIRAVCPP